MIKCVICKNEISGKGLSYIPTVGKEIIVCSVDCREIAKKNF